MAVPILSRETRDFGKKSTPQHPQRYYELRDDSNHHELVRLFTVTTNLKHRALLMTAYAAGLWVSELGRLHVADIDSALMCLRIDQGKGNKNRYVPHSPRLLEQLHGGFGHRAPPRVQGTGSRRLRNSREGTT